MSVGIIGKSAPELRVSFWIDETGARREPLKLADLGPGYKVLYCFQDWCPGCHSRGFPTLKRLVEQLSDNGFGFAVIQTVFEGADQNTLEKLRVNQETYDLRVPFGHDPAPAGRRYPTVMEDYRTAGTPWFIVINPAGEVAYNDFQLDTGRFAAALEREAIPDGAKNYVSHERSFPSLRRS
ncbi:MAG: redoxin domain-containing protein [Hyphomicrobium sp.]|nr:redoxin domain-containing protein [Hyphomicrobium sp.]